MEKLRPVAEWDNAAGFFARPLAQNDTSMVVAEFSPQGFVDTGDPGIKK
jgi:hypothetical protein